MLLYRRLASPLHATRASVGALWGTAMIATVLLSDHPLVLAALGIALLAAAVASGVGGQLARVLRPAIAMGPPIVAINVLVARQGLTVFARLGDMGPFGQGNLTVEALAYGAVIALKVALLALITGLIVLTVDPDELLRVLRRLSFRSALTASLAIRMMGVLAADAQRMGEAQRTRPGRAPSGTRGRMRLLSAVVGSSLDRALDVAATLELRGFASARAAPGPVRAFSRHDLAFVACALASVALLVLGRVTGSIAFKAYPLLHWSVGLTTFALCAVLIALVLAPFCDRRGIEP